MKVFEITLKYSYQSAAVPMKCMLECYTNDVDKSLTSATAWMICGDNSLSWVPKWKHQHIYIPTGSYAVINIDKIFTHDSAASTNMSGTTIAWITSSSLPSDTTNFSTVKKI